MELLWGIWRTWTHPAVPSVFLGVALLAHTWAALVSTAAAPMLALASPVPVSSTDPETTVPVLAVVSPPSTEMAWAALHLHGHAGQLGDRVGT